MCKNLSNLDSNMDTVNSNIEEFNCYIKLKYQGLKAKGELCDEL